MMQESSKNTAVFWMALLILPLVGMGIDIHVPSLPAIIHYYHASQASVQASVTWYLLGYGVGQLVLGALSDSLGRRSLLLICMLIYAVSCIASVLSPSIHLFLLSRLIQGLAMAGPGIAAKACISDCFSGKQLQKVTAYAGMAVAGGPVVAPALGGYLQHYLGWHACFYFLVIYSLLVFILCYVLLPETKTEREVFHINVMAANGLKVLSHPVFIASVMCAGLVFSVLAVFNVMGPFIIQVSLHLSAIQFGHAALLLGCAVFVGSMLIRWLVNYFEADRILIFTIFYMVIVSLAAVFVLPRLPFNLLFLLIPLLMIYLAVGVLTSCTFAITLSLFPKLGGTVNALRGVLMMVLTALMTLLATQLSIHTQMPLMYFYLAISIACFLIYWLLMRKRQIA